MGVEKELSIVAVAVFSLEVPVPNTPAAVEVVLPGAQVLPVLELEWPVPESSTPEVFIPLQASKQKETFKVVELTVKLCPLPTVGF